MGRAYVGSDRHGYTPVRALLAHGKEVPWGETVKAVVVLRPGSIASQEEIIEFCRGRVAGFSTLRPLNTQSGGGW